MNKICSKKTSVIIIASTVHKDPTWKAIIERLEKRGIPYLAETDVIDENGTDLIEDFMLQNKPADEEDGKSPLVEAPAMPPSKIKASGLSFQNPIDDEKSKKVAKPKPSKYQFPKFVILIDDNGDMIRRNVNLTELLKRNRHFECTTVISSQNINDLQPQAIAQLDYCLLFKNIPSNKIEEIHKKMDLTCQLDLFEQIYEYATGINQANKSGYEFLYIDRSNSDGHEEYKQSFHTSLIKVK